MWVTFIVGFYEPVAGIWVEGDFTKHFDRMPDVWDYQDKLTERIRAQYGESSEVKIKED